MTDDEKKHLTHIVQRHSELAREIQERKWEQKELEASAWEKCGQKPKVVKQLSKESGWDAVKREEQRQFEEAVDQCRSALGMLADLPLGEAALSKAGEERKAPRRKRGVEQQAAA